MIQIIPYTKGIPFNVEVTLLGKVIRDSFSKYFADNGDRRASHP